MDIDYILYKSQKIVKYLIIVLFSVIAGVGVSIALDLNNDGEIDTNIVIADEQIDGKIEIETGEIETVDVSTVESVDGGKFEEEVPDLGHGETYDISSVTAFKNSVLGKCIDVDKKWGSQCVDGFAAFNLTYTGRWLSTAGTGAAYGLWDAREENAGSDYELIMDVSQIVAGTWIVTSTGQYGHVALALGSPHNGYVTVLGENQGGQPCDSGGAAFNIINLSMKDFRGGFLPNIWKPKTPVIEPEKPSSVNPKPSYVVKDGDTLSSIMLELEGYVDWDNMDEYAKSWKSTVTNPEQIVYDGWNSNTGVGLYAGDIIQKL